jgi:signal transduction histidine kinase
MSNENLDALPVQGNLPLAWSWSGAYGLSPAVARQEERRRLGRDLHDGLGPALAAQALKVGAVRQLLPHDPAAADALLAGLEDDIGAARADIRRLVYSLRPPALDELGLAGALRAAAAQYRPQHARPDRQDQQWQAAAGEGLRITVEAPDDRPALPAAVEVPAYRIVQEALTNVVRHAHARTCTIRLRVNRGVDLTIADDGAGLSPRGNAGVGLVSMRERAAELGGTCTIGPGPTGGTEVRAHLPRADGRRTKDDRRMAEAEIRSTSLRQAQGKLFALRQG